MKTDWFNLYGRNWPYVQHSSITGAKPSIWTESDIEFYRGDAVPGKVMLDIGAFTGDTLFPFAVLGCKILAFEPNPFTYKALMENRDALRSVGVVIDTVNQAVMPECGRLTFNYTPDFVNGGLDSPDCPKLVEVDCIPWSDALMDGDRLCYIKIDTEGQDFRILKSMESTIGKYKPVIRAEVFFKLTLEQRRDAARWIESIGYQIRSGGEALSAVVPLSPDVILEPDI